MISYNNTTVYFKWFEVEKFRSLIGNRKNFSSELW